MPEMILPIIMTFFTFFIALFTGLTFWVYRKLRVDQYQAELVFDVHNYTKHSREFLQYQGNRLSSDVKKRLNNSQDNIPGIQCIFVNPGGVPTIIEKIEIEPSSIAESLTPVLTPRARDESIYIYELPWVIKSGGFAIYYAFFDSEGDVKASVSYRCNKYNRYRDFKVLEKSVVIR